MRKRQEAFYVERLLKLMNIDATIVDDAGEAPDVIIQIGAVRTGVEVTEIFRDSRSRSMSLQAREAFAHHVLMRAKQTYIESGGVPASVSVHFSLNYDLRKIQRDALSSQLAAFVRSLGVGPDQLKQWRSTGIDDPLPEAVNFVQAYGFPAGSLAHHWSAPSAGWVATLTPQILQSRIDEKSRLLVNYRSRIRENWLLLVSDGARPSQFFDPPTDEVARAVTSPFDRTFYLASFKGIAIELGTTRHDAQQVAATDN